MKKYLYWGKNPYYTLQPTFSLVFWGLPFFFWSKTTEEKNKWISYCFELKFLCFGIQFEIWFDKRK